jgi:hypothetical protein
MTTETFGTLPASEAVPAILRTPAAPAQAPKLSLLDELAEEAQKSIETFVTYAVDRRPGWSLRFSTLLEIEDVKRYQRQAQGKKKRIEDSDPIIQNGMPLVERNVAILKDGVEVLDADGDNLTLGSSEFRDMMGEPVAVQALLKFVGDGALLSMGGSLFREAGYGEDLEPLDPTES